MSDIGTPSGIDRRTLLKGAAVAGVAAWTAPMIIDSVTSPAAAASGATIPCSWFYVAFKKPGDSVVYWTGSNSNACNTLSTNNAGTTCKTCGGTTYSLFNGQGVMKYGSQCGSGLRDRGGRVVFAVHRDQRGHGAGDRRSHDPGGVQSPEFIALLRVPQQHELRQLDHRVWQQRRRRQLRRPEQLNRTTFRLIAVNP